MATKNKYDRQLRLWGPRGQRCLSESTAVLVHATPAGTETLKNLVLPGIGSFVVVDDGTFAGRQQQQHEVFCDFFAVPPTDAASSSDGVGSGTDGRASRAEVTCRNLSELNPDVSGSFRNVPDLEQCDYGQLLKSIMAQQKSATTTTATTAERPSAQVEGDEEKGADPDAAGSAAAANGDDGDGGGYGKVLVIAADLPPKPLLSLSKVAYSHSIPLLIIKSYGLIGSVRVQLNRHCIVESRPDHSLPDLRLSSSKGLFPGLRKLVDEIDLDGLSDMDHGHVPFVILLVKALDEWRAASTASASASSSAVEAASSGGNGNKTHCSSSSSEIPMTPNEKSEFRSILRSMSSSRGGPEKELNFDEALRESYLAYATRRLPDEVQTLIENAEERFRAIMMEEEEGNRLGDEEALKFDLLVLALKRFLDANDNEPPLNGSIPDMHGSTDLYVKLQEAYQDQSKQDRDAMRCILNGIAKEVETMKMDDGEEEEVGMEEKGSNAMDVEGEPQKKEEDRSERAPRRRRRTKFLPTVSDDDLATFCRNVDNLRVVSTRPYATEYARQAGGGSADSPSSPSPLTPIEEEIRDDLLVAAMDPTDDPTQTPLLWYVALRACDSYHEQNGSYPGRDGRALALASDADEVQRHIESIVKNLGLDGTDLVRSTLLKNDGTDGASTPGGKAPYAAEMVRYDNAEIHAVSAVVGGVASQEAVKIVTNQYVPLDDTYVYNGIASTAAVYRF